MKTQLISRSALRGFAALSIAATVLVGCSPAEKPGSDDLGESTLTLAPEATTESTAAPSADPETESSSEPVSQDADTAGSNVTVAIVGVSAIALDAIEVRSFITDYVGEGTCTIVATGDDGTVHEASVEALPDAKSTTCPTTKLAGLEPGTYAVVVKFDGGERFGESSAQSVEVGA